MQVQPNGTGASRSARAEPAHPERDPEKGLDCGKHPGQDADRQESEKGGLDLGRSRSHQTRMLQLCRHSAGQLAQPGVLHSDAIGWDVE